MGFEPTSQDETTELFFLVSYSSLFIVNVYLQSSTIYLLSLSLSLSLSHTDSYLFPSHFRVDIKLS